MLLCHEHGLNQSGNLLDDPVHAHGRIHGRIHFVMMRAGVQDQNPGSSVRLLHHVGQVMAIVLGKRGTEDDQVEGLGAQGFQNDLAVEGGGHLISGFADLGGLGGKRSLVGLAVENLDRLLASRLVGGLLCGCGQGTLLKLNRSIAIGGLASEVTEDQGPRDELWCTGIAWAIMAAESRAVIFFQHNMFLESRASGLLVARSLLGLAARVTGGVIEAPRRAPQRDHNIFGR